MSQHSINFIAKALHLSVYELTAYGEISGMFVCIHNQAFSATVTIAAAAPAAHAQYDFSQFCADNKKRLLIKEVSFAPPNLTIYLDSRFGALTARRVISSFNELLGKLTVLGITSACTGCGAPAASAALHCSSVLYLCDLCFVDARQKLEQHSTAQNSTGSYLRGLYGAAVGGLIGMVPWILLGLIGYVASASSLFMAWLCTRFYRKFNGKAGRPMVFIVLAMLILFSGLGAFASWLVLGLISGYSLRASVAYAVSDMTLTGPIGDLTIGLLLAGIGLFFYLRALSSSVSKDSFTMTRAK